MDGETRLRRLFAQQPNQAWFSFQDEYKEYLYKRKPDRYKNIDVGDISKQLEVKERMKCKPFKYFLEEVAPDMLEKYPPYQTEFASGVVRAAMPSCDSILIGISVL